MDATVSPLRSLCLRAFVVKNDPRSTSKNFSRISVDITTRIFHVSRVFVADSNHQWLTDYDSRLTEFWR